MLWVVVLSCHRRVNWPTLGGTGLLPVLFSLFARTALGCGPVFEQMSRCRATVSTMNQTIRAEELVVFSFARKELRILTGGMVSLLVLR